MKVTVSLGKLESSQKIDVEVASSESSVRELIAKVRRRLPREVASIVEVSESGGSRLFLTLEPNGPVMLDEDKCLQDYNLNGDCTLWLMCSHYKEKQDSLRSNIHQGQLQQSLLVKPKI